MLRSTAVASRRYTIALATATDERQEISSTRLSGRRPGPTGHAQTASVPRLNRVRPAGARRISQDGPRNINMPGYREVVRCAQCGTVVSGDVGLDSRACAAAPTCTPARSARRSIPAADSSACSRFRHGSPRRTRRTLHVVFGPDHRRAGNHGAAPRRRAEGVRRPVQVLGPCRHGAAF